MITVQAFIKKSICIQCVGSDALDIWHEESSSDHTFSNNDDLPVVSMA